MSGPLRFAWDERKNAQNRRKHGISFKEAQTVFFDEQALLISDPDHSEQENRFLLLGLSSALRTLLVCHCYRRNDEVIRIISARRANREEREQYETGGNQ
ncbi:MAG: BrnT family toxin [Bryobacterales bacterium]